ncbi:MAG: sugar ABC transporter permease [Clostridiales bacterium]|nr:MAG: sugar ABC transporter permease [Clostridiales bacterium]
MLKKVRKYWQLYLLVIPAIIYVLIFSYGPMYGIIIAFEDFRPKRGYLGSEWVGLEHFIRFITYPDFWKLIKNTLSLSLYSLLTFPCAIILALLINEIKNTKFKKTVQMVTYAPHFLSIVVMCSLVVLMVGRDGPLGHLYAMFTGKSENLLTIPSLFSSIYVWSGVWQSTGWGTIIYLAALSGISPDLIEAAEIDGANRLQVIRHVNIPGIMPTIVIMFIMSVGGILSVGFEKVFLLQNDLNLGVSNVISTYTYQIGLIGGQFSYSTAIGLFNNIVNIIMLFLANTVLKKVSGTGLF